MPVQTRRRARAARSLNTKPKASIPRGVEKISKSRARSKSRIAQDENRRTVAHHSKLSSKPLVLISVRDLPDWYSSNPFKLTG